MSFGGGGGGGFGQSNNNQSGFGGGGFGTTNNTNSGFGSNTNTGSTMFGQSSNTGSSMFGNNNNNNSNTSFGGFGSNTNNNTSFGSKPFSSTGTSGLFGGGGTSGLSFGGFGATSGNNNNNNNTTTFGSGGNSGGLFGQSKSTFGGGGTTGGGLFGGGGNTSGGFGTNASSTGGFGSTSSPFGGGAQNQPSQNNGTGATPFTPFAEKEASGTSQYQTITFQAPYQNYSLEELRAVDYNQGRRYGNSNGQAGAFGQNTGFGGFGNNTSASSGFGSNTNTNTGGGGGGLFGGGGGSSFGQTNNTTFGSTPSTNTGGGLFGQQNKPGGLFGSTPTSQPSSGGGLFGSSNNNAGAFGSGNTGSAFGSTSTGGGMFGQNNQTQNKPAFGGGGGFGAPNTNTSGSGNLFGQSSNTGGLFGSQNQASSAPAFGSNQQTTTTGGGLFGGGSNTFGQNNQPQNQQTGGLFGSTGGFGQSQQNQQKPGGGLFGNNTATNSTGGGLFGQPNQNQQAGGGLFGGSTNNQNQAGGLFGSKPAGTGGGLFGSTGATGGTTGGGLFGNLNNQNTQNSGSLFGGQNNQQKPGLFGSSATNTNAGGGLFGSVGQNNAGAGGSSLFGGQNQQQQQQSTMNNSLFGASGGSLLQTSTNVNPYGNDSLFAGLATPMQSPGPLATPLSSSQKNRKSAILPQHKLDPSKSSRLTTPQNRKIGGYGFTYSTYGTPASASSASSPGYSSSLFNSGSLGRSLGKSLSTSNLRNSFTPDTSILAPGAFSTNGRSLTGGSLKKLNINRNINARVPLFDETPSTTKRVSFARGSSATNGINEPVTNGADPFANSETSIALIEEPEEASPMDSSRTSTTVNGDTTGNTFRTPEMAQVNGDSVTPKPVSRALVPASSSALNQQSSTMLPGDPDPGEYWSQPTLDQLKSMTKKELQSVPNFVVGRERVGKILFNYGKPVDMSNVQLDRLFGDIVRLVHRHASVYGENCDLPKPANGTSINMPSRVILENSWPRKTKTESKLNIGGIKLSKHQERLRRVHGTQFEAYEPETGIWKFTVPHFSSYGLNYDDFHYNDDDLATSELSAAPDTPDVAMSANGRQTYESPQDDESIASPVQSSPDDTFDFKKGKRKLAAIPGEYDDNGIYDEEVDDSLDNNGESFLGQRSVGSLDGHAMDYQGSESESVEDEDMADPISGPVRTTELPAAKGSDSFKDSIKPKSILKPTQFLRPTGTPSKAQLVFDDDWANQLQRTISPKKQDRPTFKEAEDNVLQERDGNTAHLAHSFNGSVIATRMDLMESLFGKSSKETESMKKRTGYGIKLPYSKRPKTSNDLSDLNDSDRDFHDCNKPHFSEAGILAYVSKGFKSLEDGIFATALQPIVGAHKDTHFAKMPTFADATPPTLEPQKRFTSISNADEIPHAKLTPMEDGATTLDFEEMAKNVDISNPSGVHEQQAWQLLSILFDENDQTPSDMTTELFKTQSERFRKDRLSEFWQALVFDDADKHARTAIEPEEQAIAYLSGHCVPDACMALLNGMDLRLASMVAQIGGDVIMRRDIEQQIDEWRRMDMLAEMEDSVRTLYELLAGNCAQSEGHVTGAGPENRASTFSIARRFGLDWRRAFGLRLWYGTQVGDPIEYAVAQFADSLRDGLEDVKPVPWFVEQEVDVGWTDRDSTSREDILWGILKLYASSKLDIPVNVEDVLSPENVSGHPLNARLSFQMFQIFKSREDDEMEMDERKVGLPIARIGESVPKSFMSSTTSQADEQAENPLVELGDKLALTYAASLHTSQHWTNAVFVYEHLSSPGLREHHIRSLLTQFSNTYSLAEDDAIFQYLVDLRVPQTWMHSAAALQAQTEGDDSRQVMHLIKAQQLDEAHEVLCRSVGPDAIISRDYDALRELLGDFVPTPTSSPLAGAPPTRGRPRRGPKEPVSGWSQGGQIYFDYIHLLDLTNHQSPQSEDEDLHKEINGLLTKLQHSLEAVAASKWKERGLQERIALSEIAGVVAGLIAKRQPTDRARVLKLPLTEDLWLKHSTDLSVDYYRAVMASAK
ncbi:hypothetical protein EJ04DRAFT_508511 [Polyplosphaeria fusca]|uniref:Peptidase S59 domain-containing protein n=1 Tax=Polyplosphaeria fusca TaxID=682080 RepID=A0A9P4RA88_9PLEO|nr:hypothetical protein EJ04DRAFT_508511 [Polyplosphaeria fusca]